MEDAEPEARVRGRGRPRSERVEAAILDTALEMLGEKGFEGITMEALAARAGVGKAAIYRRWKKKNDLLVDAFVRAGEPAAMIDSGDLRADLVAFVDILRRKLTSSVSGTLTSRMLGAAINDPDLMEVYWRTAVLPRRVLFLERLQRSVARGELRPDLDLDVFTDMCFAPTIYRWLFSAGRPVPRREDIAQSIDILLAGALPS